MMTVKVFVGGTAEEARAAYKAWWGQQQGIEIIGEPTLEPAGSGWKLVLRYRSRPQ